VSQARAPEIRFEAPPERSALGTRLSRIERARLDAIARLVGLIDPGPPITVLLVPEDTDLARGTPPWVAGFARGADEPIVVFADRSPSYPYDSIEDVLQHEIAHVLIERAAAGQRVPRWFHEGLALSAEREWGFEDRMRSTFALMRSVDPAALDRMFAGDASEQARAYAIAGAWVRDLMRRHGSGTPAHILRQMASGTSFPVAHAIATGETVETSAVTFWRESWWYQIVPFVTSSVVLWLGVTLLALFAIRTRKARSAARRKRWEEEELRTTNDERRTTNDERRTTNDE
jgi:hypothetical protein